MNKKVALQLHSSCPWKETALAMQKAGFKYAAMALDENLLAADGWKETVKEMAACFGEYGLTCVMTHAPYYDLLISAEKRMDLFEIGILRCIEATKMLGAEICAVHPRSFITDGAPYETAVDREKSLRENIKSFKPQVDACEKFNVKLGIENLMRYPVSYPYPYFYSWIAEDQAELIDSLNSDRVCAIWDFGHANIVDTDHAQRIRTVGSRIKGTHVHNNGGRDDNHFPPFMPPQSAYYAERTVDWKSVLAALRSTGFDGYLTLETVINYQYPIEPYIKYLYDSVCTLDDYLHENP